MRIFPEPEVLSQQIEKRPWLFTFYTSCANFSSVAPIVASESWCVKNNNKNNKNNSKEGTAESVKGQRAVAPLTLNIHCVIYEIYITSYIFAFCFVGFIMYIRYHYSFIAQFGNKKICPIQKIHVARRRSPRETWIFLVGQIFVSPN